MANGLDAGDSVKGSDTFKFYRGERSVLSPGERDVPIRDLVTYLNDTSVLTNVGGGGGATADELARLTLVEKNLGINFLRDAVAEGWTIFDLVDGFVDEYEDETGVNTGASSGYTFVASDYYQTTLASSHDLLIQSGGDSNGSQSFSDSSGTHTPSAVGNAQHSTAQAKFGTSSIAFDGSGDGITVPDSADFELDTGDWTVDMFVYFNGAVTSGTELLIKKGNEATSDIEWRIYRQASGEIGMQFSTNGTAYTNTINSTSAGLVTQTWHHVRLSHSGGTVTFYIDGVNKGTGSFSAPTGTTVGLTIGDSTSLGDLNGYLEEISILKGTARDGTVPSSPYSLSVSDLTLVGASQTAASAPSNIRMVMLYTPVDSSTLNTDVTLEISRDGGTTYSTYTLEYEADYDGTVQILTTEDIDVTGQPSGTSIVYRIKTLNNKNQRFHGVWVQWR